MPRATLLILLLIATVVAWLVHAVPAPGKSPGWLRPVQGQPVRGFDLGADPFEGGRHRGVDFAGAPGELVRAACAGRVAFTGRVADAGRVVSVICGSWRVTYLPLGAIAVRPRALVARGTRLGTTEARGSHRGLHVGVRREGHRFGYVDPLRFFGDRPRLPLVRVGRPRRGPRGLRRPARPPAPAPATLPRLAPAPATLPRPAPAPAMLPRPARTPASLPHSSPSPAVLPHPPPAPTGLPLAPWPAWLGLGLVLAGAFGTTARRVRRRGAAQALRAGEAGKL